MTTTTTKAAKVVAALENGTELTAKQIESRYSVKNARALISSLRGCCWQSCNCSGYLTTKYL